MKKLPKKTTDDMSDMDDFRVDTAKIPIAWIEVISASLSDAPNNSQIQKACLPNAVNLPLSCNTTNSSNTTFTQAFSSVKATRTESAYIPLPSERPHTLQDWVTTPHHQTSSSCPSNIIPHRAAQKTADFSCKSNLSKFSVPKDDSFTIINVLST